MPKQEKRARTLQKKGRTVFRYSISENSSPLTRFIYNRVGPRRLRHSYAPTIASANPPSTPPHNPVDAPPLFELLLPDVTAVAAAGAGVFATETERGVAVAPLLGTDVSAEESAKVGAASGVKNPAFDKSRSGSPTDLR